MLTQLEVITPGVVTPPLPIGGGSVESDMIQIKKIDGLEPVKVSVNTTPYGSIDGENYTGSSRGKRNIVITVGLSPDWSTQTIESLRLALYQYFMPETFVRLRFTSTHIVPVEIDGYVESMEPDIFSLNPEIQISIICPQPDFVATDATAIPGETTEITDTSSFQINYKGSMPAGFVLDVTSIGTTLSGELRVVKLGDPPQLFAMAANVDANNSVRISTMQGDKYILAVPSAGTTENILEKIVPGSAWISLTRGTNAFQIQSASPPQAFSLRYFERYGGL